jgi:threonylcarbamoyladenosine tRNA methylthiotransferase MtaB
MFNQLNIGQVTNVLFESTRSEGLTTGLTSNYIRVEHPWDQQLTGKIKKVKLNKISQSGRISIEIMD